jgi:hypothetical protein
MTAGIHNFVCERGSEFLRKISWVDVEGESVNLGDAWVQMQVRESFDSENTIIDISENVDEVLFVDSAIYVDPEDSNSVLLYINPQTTESLNPGIYVYDIVVGRNDNPDDLDEPWYRVIRLMQGQFTVNDMVTDPRDV